MFRREHNPTKRAHIFDDFVERDAHIFEEGREKRKEKKREARREKRREGREKREERVRRREV